ncbi:hypothetical protein MMC15_007526 [Xylographa vitiligo]|nr:hypothetical protein [Xylographa vitiligo]
MAKGENTKKVAGNAKKAEVAAQKAAAESSKKAASEDAEWSKGAKSTAKKCDHSCSLILTCSSFFAQSLLPLSVHKPLTKFLHTLSAFREQEAAKREEAARKKAEKDALLAEEEKSARAAPKNAKTAVKKTNRGLDLSQLDDEIPTTKTAPALNASNIDDALDALSITTGNPNAQQVDRHPERRFKAAYAAYEARRLPELETEMKGLRRQQRMEVVRKEFEKSPENPFNQVSARFDSTRDEVRQIKAEVKDSVEGRLGSGS